MGSVEELRLAGNELFKQGKFDEAASKYSDALALEPENHLLYSNRSLALSSAGKFAEAAQDAEQCLRIDSGFMKGYYRLANAQAGQGLLEEAVATVRRGLAAEPENAELKKMLRVLAAKKEGLRLGKQRAAARAAAPDEDTRKHIQELSEQLGSAQRELGETTQRLVASKREVTRGELTIAEIQGTPDDRKLFRSVGKMFLRRTKPQVETMLKEQTQANAHRVTALESRKALLERNLQSMTNELQAMTTGAA